MLETMLDGILEGKFREIITEDIRLDDTRDVGV